MMLKNGRNLVKVVFMVLVVSITAALLLTGCGDGSREPKIVAWSKAKDYSAEKKLSYLKSLLASGKSERIFVFYQAAMESDPGDKEFFKQALGEAGSASSLIYLGPATQEYVVALLQDWEKNNPRATVAEAQKIIEKQKEKVLKMVDGFYEEIKSIARKEPQPLIAQLKKELCESKEPDSNMMVGPMLGMAALELEGFELALKASEEKCISVAILIMESVGSDAVEIILRAYEDPKSSKETRKVAGSLIFALPLDKADVIDELIAAYKYGRYFPIDVEKNAKGESVLNIKDIQGMLELAMSWWGNMVEAAIRTDDNKDNVIAYIAKKHLPDPENQSEVIKLLSNIDFVAARPYFEELDPSIVSEESVDALFSACYPSPSSDSDEEDLEELCSFFCSLFPKCTSEQRKKAIFASGKYPADKMASFFIKNFSILTDDEKDAAIYFASSFPPNLRDKVFKEVVSQCNDQQKLLMR